MQVEQRAARHADESSSTRSMRARTLAGSAPWRCARSLKVTRFRYSASRRSSDGRSRVEPRCSSASSSASAAPNACARTACSDIVCRAAGRSQHADQRRERAALHDERGDDQQERAEQDQVAAGEVGGQRDRGREAHDAAHARPAEHDGLAPRPRCVAGARARRRPGSPSRRTPTRCARRSRRRWRAARRAGRPSAPRLRGSRVRGSRAAQADQDEHERVEHEHDRFPGRLRLDPHVGVEHAMLAHAEHGRR